MRRINDTFVPPKRSPGYGGEPHVRSYVLDKSFVKDLRTGVTSDDPQAALDGDLDAFLKASLAMSSALVPTGSVKPEPE